MFLPPLTKGTVYPQSSGFQPWMIFFNVTLNRLLVESFVIAKVAEESDNLLVNDKFVVPESRL